MIIPLIQRAPGPMWVKVPLALAVVALASWALMEWVFPSVDAALFPSEQVAVQ